MWALNGRCSDIHFPLIDNAFMQGLRQAAVHALFVLAKVCHVLSLHLVAACLLSSPSNDRTGIVPIRLLSATDRLVISDAQT